MKLRKQRRRFYAAHKELYSTPFRKVSWLKSRLWAKRLMRGEIGVLERISLVTTPYQPIHSQSVYGMIMGAMA